MIFFEFCREPFKTIVQLIEHLKEAHRHDLLIEMEISNWKEFMAWKELQQTMNKSWFVKHRGDRKTKDNIVSWFYCNRSGYFISRGGEKRCIKAQGSSKIHG